VIAPDRVRYWRHPVIDGVDLMRARFNRHEFARHSHDTFAIGVTEVGAEDLGFDRGDPPVLPGGICLINPGDVHTGRAATPGEWGYRVLYPTVGLMSTVASELGIDSETPAFRERVVYDDVMSAAIIDTYRAAGAGDRLESSVKMEMLLARLLRRYGASGRPPDVVRAGRRCVTDATAVLEGRMSAPPTLDELAVEVGTGKYALLRAFRDVHGLPPYAYLAQLRVRRAQRLLLGGMKPAAAASTVGFVDQAHLSRHFRRIVGIPPGAYRRAHGWGGATTYKTGGPPAS